MTWRMADDGNVTIKFNQGKSGDYMELSYIPDPKQKKLVSILAEKTKL